MKKIGFLLLAACAAIGLSSCNNDSGNYSWGSSLVTVRTFGGISSDYYFESDGGEKIHVGDRSRVGSYVAEDGNRALITYQFLDEKKEGYDYNILLYTIDDIRWGDTRTVTSQEELDLLGSDKTSLYVDQYYGQYAIGATTEILNANFVYYASDTKKHTFTLVKPDFEGYVPETTENGYLNLELRHHAGEEDTKQVKSEWMSFRLDDFAADLSGMKGIIVSMKTHDSDEDKILSIKVDFQDLK